MRRERLLEALESGKIAAEALRERLEKLDRERAQLASKRSELDRMHGKLTPIPTVEMFRELGEQLRERVATAPTAAAKALLARLLGRVLVSPTGQLTVELTLGRV
ncbi:MAG TPA: hypothetical protein VLM91_12875 [Candidatus Methylomirabilis sp.]|nr:hypothetical protein [Candidatus Methylomirabilis sp.]